MSNPDVMKTAPIPEIGDGGMSSLGGQSVDMTNGIGNIDPGTAGMLAPGLGAQLSDMAQGAFGALKPVGQLASTANKAMSLAQGPPQAPTPLPPPMPIRRQLPSMASQLQPIGPMPPIGVPFRPLARY
jgi:hypothetical protein